ncbi:MAG: zinc ribbon domain-containing protein [Chitinophagales bacterium]
MNVENFCQSCSMPLSAENYGTERDGSSNHEYCIYCYKNGSFTNPDLTFHKMKLIVISEMQKRNIDQKMIDIALKTLPYLKRWQEKIVL